MWVTRSRKSVWNPFVFAQFLLFTLVNYRPLKRKVRQNPGWRSVPPAPTPPLPVVADVSVRHASGRFSFQVAIIDGPCLMSANDCSSGIPYGILLVILMFWYSGWFRTCCHGKEIVKRQGEESQIPAQRNVFRVAFSSLHFLLSFYIITDVIKCGVWLRFRYFHSYTVGCESCNWLFSCFCNAGRHIAVSKSVSCCVLDYRTP